MSIPAGTPVERYDVQKLIGAGAMGEVFLALDRELGRKVALKILSDAHRDNRELRARFIREARAVAAISHPNVVQVFTTGEFDGRPYFAMEYLAGRDLGSIVREKGPLSPRAAAASLLDAARGLEAAADAGLIHRDVKPSNLVRLDSGPVKVTDFGLAKPMMPTEDPALTALGVVVGTPDYIAPEQARGEEIDSRVDVYALGCTAFFLLVGRPPFRRGNEDEDKYLKVVARHLREPPPDARRHAEAPIDDTLAELALEMMQKNPGDRPGYVDLIAKLDEIQARLAARSPTASRAVPPVARASSAPPRASSAQPRAASAPPRASGAQPASRAQTASRAAAPPKPPPRLNDDSVTFETPPRRAWVWLVTAASVAIFCTGLGLRLFGRREAPAATLAPGAKPSDALPAPAAPRPADGGGGAGAGAGTVAEPAAPDGMLVVRDPAGKAAFFVDRVPVTNRAYAELIRSHRYPRAEADRPVTGVSHDYAKAYAKMRGKRLIRNDEWQAALDTLGFVPAGMRTWEWVDDGREDARDRPVRRVNEGQDRRKPAGDKTITFRLAKDLT